jgi:hypothetical protein
MSYYILDENGNVQPCELLTWAAWFEDNREKRRLAHDVLPGAVEVSTIFLGVDHDFGSGPPLIFETMIFGGPHDQYQERYSTKAQALDGHARAVAMARGEKVASSE